MEELFNYAKTIGESKLFIILIITVLGDILSGKIDALYHKDYNSYTGIKGISKHLLIVTLMILFFSIAKIGHVEIIFSYVCVFYIIDYLISILKHLSYLNIPLPPFLYKYFKEIKKKDSE